MDIDYRTDFLGPFFIYIGLIFLVEFYILEIGFTSKIFGGIYLIKSARGGY